VEKNPGEKTEVKPTKTIKKQTKTLPFPKKESIFQAAFFLFVVFLVGYL